MKKIFIFPYPRRSGKRPIAVQKGSALTGIVIFLLLVFAGMLILGKKYSEEPQCAEPGCSYSAAEGSSYCYKHSRLHDESSSEAPKTTKAVRKSSAPASAKDSDPYNARGYDDFDDFYNDHYKDFFSYDDAKEYYRSVRAMQS